MKKQFLFVLCTLLLSLTAMQLNAQVISFSMTDEASNQNTPAGWTAVQLPTGLPTFTTDNTFYITNYGASTSSADNTAAIQAALDAASAAGGGMVVVPTGTYLTSYLTIGSKTVLHLCAGATLKMLSSDNYLSNGKLVMDSPLITGKSGASDIVIEGESRETSIIDGQGGPWWDAVEDYKKDKTNYQEPSRQALIRFWQGSRYLFRNFRIQNAPNTNITIGKSGNGSNATAHDITIKNPASSAVDPSHNTDGFPIWTQYVNIYDCEIDTGDDNVVTDKDAQYVHVWNCELKAGHGASLGSFTTNMHDIIYEDLTFTGTDCGFRLKSNIGRSGDVYGIVFRNCTMTNVPSPFIITSWYDDLPSSPTDTETTATTYKQKNSSQTYTEEFVPKFHDILIQDVTVSGHTTYKNSEKNYWGIFIYGRPESKVYDVTFDNVNITHSKGIKMNFCEGIKFYDNCSFEVSNTNKTEKNAVATATLDNVIEEQYECDYVWKEPKFPPHALSVTWSMASGSSSTAVVDPAKDLQSATWSYGSDVTIDGTATGTYFDKTFTRFTRVGDSKLDNNRSQLNNSYVEFRFTPAEGMTVKPTSLSFDITKIGTGDPNIWVECIQGSSTTSIAANVTIRKASESTPSEHLSYNLASLNDIVASSGETAFRIYIGKLAKDKQVGIANFVVNCQSSGEAPDPVGYTNTWQFGKSNGAEEFALEHSAEYTYTVNEHSLNINTDAGKLNNAGRNDQWAQCNNGTLFKVPTFVGAKLTWGRYSGGSETGFTIDEQLFNEYYIATAEGTTNMTATGIDYLSFIKVEPVTMYEITGTITGGDINGNNIIFTAAGNGQKYSATVAGNAFTLKVPADTYTPELGGGVAYVVSTPAAVTVSKAGSIGAITIEAASAQTVTGAIANAPAEAFTLTFTGANNVETVNCAANATSFPTTLAPDTYVMSSNVGTLSALSVESFQVVNDAVNHNIYFPEAAVPAATQQNITVDNTLSTATANNYKTVTDALAAAKAGSISSPVITLTSGQTYREQVVVDQANVTLKTSGTEKATITWYYGIGYTYYSLGANGLYDKDRANTRNSIKMIDPVRWGTAVLVKSTGNGFKAENIIFENSFNQYYTTEEVADGVRPNGQQAITYDRTLTSGQTGYKAADSRAATERAAAIAFENDPTGCQLYNCTFRGSQDTFYSSGKLYVKKCNIIGNTDYIFGGGYVVFDDCDLTVGGYSDSQNTAYITAYKAGETLDASKKYVFRDCTVKATDRAYVSANLGRDWGGAAASVYFFNLKNEIGDKMSYTWTNMGGGVSAGTADLHIYDFDPAINSNYSTTGSSGANINGLVNDANALSLYTGVVTSLGFTPEHIYDIPLDENSYYNTLRINASNDGAGNITLTRSIAANKWSTICLPFAMTSAQLKSTFGDDVKVAELTGGSETTMNFTSLDLTNAATTTVANKPYAIKVGTAFTSATIDGVTVVEGTPEQDAINGWTFSGNYIKTNVPQYAYFFQNNYLKQASGTGVSLKPFRGYFTYVTPQAGREVLFDLDSNSATGISLTPYPSPKGEGSEFFNLAGQRVTKSYKGVVIVNGKKVVRK